MIKRLGWIVLSVSIVVPCLGATTVYETKQKDGIPSFSDMPSSGAKAMVVTASSVTLSPSLPSQTPATSTAVATSQAVYQQLSVIEPTNEATIRSNIGDVRVSFIIVPALRADDAIQVLVDGKVITTQKTGASLTLSGVTRGAHILRVQILDGSGQMIKTSPSVTFYLHRTNKP